MRVSRFFQGNIWGHKVFKREYTFLMHGEVLFTGRTAIPEASIWCVRPVWRELLNFCCICFYQFQGYPSLSSRMYDLRTMSSFTLIRSLLTTYESKITSKKREYLNAQFPSRSCLLFTFKSSTTCSVACFSLSITHCVYF